MTSSPERPCAAVRGRSQPSSVPMAISTTSPSLRYFGFLAWLLKNSFHLVAAGSSELMSCTGFAGALNAVPTGVPVSSRSPGSSRWNRLNATSASSGEKIMSGSTRAS